MHVFLSQSVVPPSHYEVIQCYESKGGEGQRYVSAVSRPGRRTQVNKTEGTETEYVQARKRKTERGSPPPPAPEPGAYALIAGLSFLLLGDVLVIDIFPRLFFAHHLCFSLFPDSETGSLMSICREHVRRDVLGSGASVRDFLTLNLPDACAEFLVYSVRTLAEDRRSVGKGEGEGEEKKQARRKIS